MKRLWKMAIAAVILAAAAFFIILYLRWDRCVITQFYDTTDMQGMFYTVKHRGKLLVIDGGNTGNAEYVGQVIEMYGGHVDAWILTHPHPDHIGAFNELWSTYCDRIDLVLAPEFDYDDYLAKAREWDGFEYYTRFLDEMSESDQLEYVHAGDTITLCGLTVKILNAYDNYVKERSNDLANDGSMMFRLTHQKETMLFCADVGQGMSDFLLSCWENELPGDYVQMGHHGNGGLKEDFYRKVNPKAAFFDAPGWLMNPEDASQYDTPNKKRLMESLGATIYDYTTAPNTIKLQ